MIVANRGNELFVKSTTNEVSNLKIYQSRKNFDYKLLSLFPSVSNSEVATNSAYQCSVKIAKRRLDILGFTLGAAKSDFDQSKNIVTTIINEVTNRNTLDVGYALPLFPVDKYAIKNKEIINQLTFDDYKSELEKHIEQCRKQPYYQTLHTNDCSIENYIAGAEDRLFGFLCSDERFWFRVLLELLGESEEILLRLPTSDSHTPYPSERGNASFRDNHKQERIRDSAIIILSEGKTDIEILKPALQLLYPDVADLYTFFEFEPDIFATSGKGGERDKVNGSASMLTNMVKAFVAADINHRIIAIFDNDAAGLEASHYLRGNSNLPKNIKILTYPDIERLKSYPVTENNVSSNKDINGHAASIEMYLGSDCLKDDSDNFFKVIQGRNVGNSGWQGNLGNNKDKPRRKFMDKINCCNNNLTKIDDYDWTGVELIFSAIFSAFNHIYTGN